MIVVLVAGLVLGRTASADDYPMLVHQVVDANVMPAVQIEVVDSPSGWISTGDTLIAAAPPVRVRSNVGYTLRDAAVREGAASVPSVSVRMVGGRVRVEPPTERTGRAYAFEIVQIIDYNLPRLVDTDGWRVEIVYTFLPASI